jgi:hypothetical protein
MDLKAFWENKDNRKIVFLIIAVLALVIFNQVYGYLRKNDATPAPVKQQVTPPAKTNIYKR